MTMKVFDTSAVLALMLDEPGGDVVIANLSGGMISAVNVVEVLSRLSEGGMNIDAADAAFGQLGLEIMNFDHTLALEAARMRLPTRSRGLSLGDRACLALALRENVPAMTADRQWDGVDVGVEIRLIR